MVLDGQRLRCLECCLMDINTTSSSSVYLYPAFEGEYTNCMRLTVSGVRTNRFETMTPCT